MSQGVYASQQFNAVMTLSLPATISSQNDVINFLNSAGVPFWNNVLSGVLTLEKFAGMDITSINVSNAAWGAANGHATIFFKLNTVSDPVTALALQNALTTLWGLLLVAIGAALVLIPVFGLFGDIVGTILALSGALSLLSASVTQVGTAVTSNPIFLGIGVIVLAVGGIWAYSYFKQVKGKT